MPKITYHHADGSVATVAVDAGASIMRAALDNSIAGIVGECGGQAMCATCHVLVRGDHALPDISEDEDEMLECTIDERGVNSRLGCQVVAGRDFDEIEVDIAEHQV
jgi:2Fe-2S ferredoxin